MVKKKKIIIICSLIVVFTLAGVGTFVYYNKVSNNLNSSETTIKDDEKTDEIDVSDTDNSDDLSKQEEVEESIEETEIDVSTNDTTNNSSSNVTSSSSKNTSNSTQNSSSNNSKNNQTQNSSQSTQTQTETSENNVQQQVKDPNAVDTSHPLYPSHHGVINYQTLSECNDAGFDKAFADSSISSFSCVEVYSNAGNVLGYYLEIRY